jgi:Flp pilus assembly protein TadD
VAHFREAIEVDPVSQQRAFDRGDTYLTLRKFPEAERQLDRTIQLAPDWAKPYGYKAMLYLMWKGAGARARAVIGHALSRVSTGRLARALMTADAISASVISSDSLFFPAADAVRADGFEADTGAYYLVKAEVAHYRSEPALERAYADSARRWLQPQLLTQPDDAKRLVHFGLASARAGRKAEALRAGRRAVALLPLTLDAASSIHSDIFGADLPAERRSRQYCRHPAAAAHLSELDHASGAHHRPAVGAAQVAPRVRVAAGHALTVRVRYVH